MNITKGSRWTDNKTGRVVRVVDITTHCSTLIWYRTVASLNRTNTTTMEEAKFLKRFSPQPKPDQVGSLQ